MSDHDATTDDFNALEAQLIAARPVPPARLRGALRRRLLALGPPSARPPHLWRLAGLHAAVGTTLLLIGVLSVAGIGPLAS